MRVFIAVIGLFVAAGLAYAQAPCDGTIEVRHNHQEAFYAPYLGLEAHQAFERLGMVDIHSGAAEELIPDFEPAFKYPEVPALMASAAFDPDGTLYTLINVMNLGEQDPTTSQLAIIDIDTGEITPVGAINPFNLTGMEIDACGQIYATGFNLPPFLVSESRLYTLDKETGLATPKENDMVNAAGEKIEQVMDLAFDAAGTLYATVGNMLYSLDTETGQVLSEVAIHGVPMQSIVNGAEGWLCGDTPESECVEQSEVMSIAFDAHGVFYAFSMVGSHRPLLEVNGVTQGAPLLTIDPASGDATVVAWTGELNFHGGDIPFSPNATNIEAVGWGVIKKLMGQ